MLYYDICKIISEWDPINIMDISPKDEYHDEARQIYEFIITNERIILEHLAEAIYRIFSKSFDEIFQASKGDCLKIASKIMNTVID